MTDSKEESDNNKEVSDDEHMFPKSKRRKINKIQEEKKSYTIYSEFNENNNFIIEKPESETKSQILQKNSGIEDGRNEEGLSKLKKKLSLKVKIPEEKRRKSAFSESNVIIVI